MQKNIHFKINEKKTIYTTDRWSHRSLPVVTKNLANTSCQAKIKSNYKLTPQVCDDITNQGAISTVFILSTDAFGFVSRKKILNINIQDIAWFIYGETKQTNKTHHLIKFCRTCEAKATFRAITSYRKGESSHKVILTWKEAFSSFVTISNASLGRRSRFSSVSSSVSRIQKWGTLEGSRARQATETSLLAEGVKGMMESAPQGMKHTLHSIPRTTQRHLGRHRIQYQTRTSQDEGRNTTEENKGLHCERHHKVIQKWWFKDSWNALKKYTSVIKCDALKKRKKKNLLNISSWQKQRLHLTDNSTLCLWI